MNELKINAENKKLKGDVAGLLKEMKKLLDSHPLDLQEQIDYLADFRLKFYEKLNQFQHKFLIIRAAEQLKKKHKNICTWKWHPEQTSHPDEPDLQGLDNARNIIVSAEITTSPSPKGVLDSRIRKTLLSLNEKVGVKYYVVKTKEMKDRAETKISKFEKKRIKVLLIK